MHLPPHPAPRTGRLRRWLIGLGLLTLLAAGYGMSLNWLIHRLGDDIGQSVHRPEVSESGMISPR
jgi:hypothetical protein